MNMRPTFPRPTVLAKTPRECGENDAYYGRRERPKKIDAEGKEHYHLTDSERAAYFEGYDNTEFNQKDWGEQNN